MPSGKIKVGHRDHILTKEFYKNFKRDNPEVDVSWDDMVDIIRESNKEISKIVSTEQTGFKLPEEHGYLTVTSFKSNQKSIDIKSSHEYGEIIYHLNLHTFGKRSAIRWFNRGYSYYPKIYKFQSCRTFSRQVAKSTKEGINFLNWSTRDFMNFDKIIKLQNNRKN